MTSYIKIRKRKLCVDDAGDGETTRQQKYFINKQILFYIKSVRIYSQEFFFSLDIKLYKYSRNCLRKRF